MNEIARPQTDRAHQRREPGVLQLAMMAAGSLRLTVFLLFVGIVIILVGSIQQTRYDILEIKNEHFSSWLVYVPFQDLMIPAWFPELTSVGGGFMLPSGLTIIIAMLVNLLAAHAVRFRVQATGARLLAGLGVLAVGVGTAAAVIANGNAEGFQEEPLISWQRQWDFMKYAMLALGAAGVAGVVLLDSPTRKLFSLIGGIAFLLIGGVLILYREDSFIGDDAMRVLWRLVQGSLAAVICYIGAVLAFRRKAGIFLVHAGLILLMAGELYTTWSAREQRLEFFEGETVGYTFDINDYEFVLMTPAEDGKLNEITIDSDALNIDGEFSDPRIPVKLRLLAWYTNSIVRDRVSDSPSMPGETGLALRGFAEPVAKVTGVDAGAANRPSAYVEVLVEEDASTGAGKSGEGSEDVSAAGGTNGNQDGNKENASSRTRSLGVFLTSVQLYRDQRFDLDSFQVGDKEWKIGLRFRQIYKPWKATLIDTKRQNYPGTMTAQSYSSEFRLVDPSTGTDEKKMVSMNVPLRYNNETFYQSGHNVTERGAVSTLQIVQNRGWLIPYVSCAFVGLGLLMHFMAGFLRYVERLPADTARAPWDAVSWICVVGSLVVFGGWVAKEMRPTEVAYQDVDLDQFGRIPVVAGGRIQPLDSLARTVLRETSKVETALDGEGNRQPAIRWIADWIYGEPGSEDYLIFKINDPDIQADLDLVRRKRNMYSWAEVTANRDELTRLEKLANQAAEADESKLTSFQKKISDLAGQVRTVENLRYALSRPELFGQADPTDRVGILKQLVRGTGLARSVPAESLENWTTVSVEKARWWLADVAREGNLQTPLEVAEAIANETTRQRLADELFKEQLMIDLARIAQMRNQTVTIDQLRALVDEILNDTSPDSVEFVERQRANLKDDIAAEAETQLPQFLARVADEVAKWLPVQSGQLDLESLPERPPLVAMDAAWQDDDAERFNELVATHLQEIQTAPGMEGSTAKVKAEYFLNESAPFFVAAVIYVVSMVLSLLAWIAMAGVSVNSTWGSAANGLRRASFWLMVLAFLVHTGGLALRVYISGRAPVTSLHSSTLFIGWACAVVGFAVERFVGYGFGAMLGSITGFMTLIASFGLATEGDTFSVLVAVLDTQFWLWTHVVCITLGYSATFAAGALGLAWMLIDVLIPANTVRLRKTLAKLVYGITCGALLFSFVGTVLGGLWADDSWGRFWGWDTKENGALMIVLANALLLHARWAGMIRDNGIAMFAIFGNVVTLWSWFAVNELGVGLHQYGLTEGRMFVVSMYWLVHGVVLAMGCLPLAWRLGERATRRALEAPEG